MLDELIMTLQSNRDLSSEQMTIVMDEILSGKYDDNTIAKF